MIYNDYKQALLQKMANVELIEQKEKKLQEIRTFLFTKCQKGIDAKRFSESEIGQKLKLGWQKAKRYLEQMKKENLVHTETFGNTVIYFPNGKPIKDKHPHHIEISKDMNLWLDNFPGSFDRPFMRLALKKGSQVIGSVIIPVDKVEEFIDKFSSLSDKLKELKKSGG